MAKSAKSGGSAPTGPSSRGGGGSLARERNTRGEAAGDSTKRATAIQDEEGAGKVEPVENEQQVEGVPEKEGKPENFVVLTDKAVIDDGKGGKLKVIDANAPVKERTVSLSPQRAAKMQRHGIALKSEKDFKKENEAA